MSFTEFKRLLGDAIDDPEEEAFILFSSSIPSSNLGFLDSRASELEVSINGHDLIIQQSPGLLNANLPGGTTGAVLWKVSPLFAAWISDTSNVFFNCGILSSNSIVLEMGAGISGLVAVSLAPFIRKYIVTDQSYVLKALRGNINSNYKPMASRKKSTFTHNIDVIELDWENSNVHQLPQLVPELQVVASSAPGFDAIIACDCIYNESLIPSFVDACATLCSLRTTQTVQHDSRKTDVQISPTICIVAQQLRSNLVFEEWLREFHSRFTVWRIPDELLSAELREGSGFVVHIGVLKNSV